MFIKTSLQKLFQHLQPPETFDYTLTPVAGERHVYLFQTKNPDGSLSDGTHIRTTPVEFAYHK